MYYTIRQATRHDAKGMAYRLRYEDAREIKSATGKRPADVLPDCVVPGKTFVLTVSFSRDYPGQMLALFGVSDARELLEGCGIPWMVATPLLIHHQMYFLRNCRKVLDKISEGYTRLVNCVDARNEIHIKWLKWCGFNFVKLHPEWGAEKLPFWQFEKSINV